MRKSEFKYRSVKGERLANSDDHALYVYKAYQYRWNDLETADPQYDDVTYHLTEQEAIQAVSVINLNLGFRAMVDRLYFTYADFNAGVDFREEFELRDLDDQRRFPSLEREEVYWGKFEDGGPLPESGFIVYYTHHKYMNYAYTIGSVESVALSRHKVYSDLRNDSDSTTSRYAYVAKDLDELVNDFESGSVAPFNKINSGRRVVIDFLELHGQTSYSGV